MTYTVSGGMLIPAHYGCDKVRIRIWQHANIQQLYSYSICNE